jgi:glycosyltransferase involved in cell wall biosynthesis
MKARPLSAGAEHGAPAAERARPGLSARPALSLVFPVFDEAGTIGTVIETALSAAAFVTPDFEIVVVDDGSADGSDAIIDDWCRRDERVHVVRHPTNAGYGAALRSGLRGARGELVFFSDADLQFDLAELGALLAHASEFDIVAGYRHPRRDPWHRTLIAAAWGLLVRFLFGLRVRDIDCAFKVFRRPVLDAIPIQSIGAFVNTEILVRAQAMGASIRQVPVSHRRRIHGRATGAHPRVLLRALFELSSLYCDLHRALRREPQSAPRDTARS